MKGTLQGPCPHQGSPSYCIIERTADISGYRVDEEEIEQLTDALRKKLTSGSDNTSKSDRKGQLKPHQVHELAAAKIEESERLRRALGISKDYEEGSHWNKQEDRLREGLGDKR